MDFYIQAGNPDILNINNKEDKTLSEAIESVFPMKTENLIIYWKHIAVSLSYKYDISYMIDDVLIILQEMQMHKTGSMLIHWLPDTFRVDWNLKWDDERILIDAEWQSVVGNIEEILKQQGKVELSKENFICEWKMPLLKIINALSKNEYMVSLKDEYCNLLTQFNNLQRYGLLYRK